MSQVIMTIQEILLETTQQGRFGRERLIHDLESALNEQKYSPISLSTTEKLLLVIWKNQSFQVTQ